MTASKQIKQLHRAHYGAGAVSLKQFAREQIATPSRQFAREIAASLNVRTSAQVAHQWLENKRRHPKKRTPAAGHAGLNWKRFGKKKSRGGGSADRSGKKGKKE